MSLLPIVRRRLVDAAVALAILLALPWRPAVTTEALIGRLAAAWRSVAAAVETPPPDEDPEPAPAPPGGQKNSDHGPTIDPDGSSAGDDDESTGGTPP